MWPGPSTVSGTEDLALNGERTSRVSLSIFFLLERWHKCS